MSGLMKRLKGGWGMGQPQVFGRKLGEGVAHLWSNIIDSSLFLTNKMLRSSRCGRVGVGGFVGDVACLCGRKLFLPICWPISGIYRSGQVEMKIGGGRGLYGEVLV